jgi:LmbE family N-acetylglucosaminyl deacetylase
MKLHNASADVYVPDGEALPGALGRTTHLGIGAHQDDLEILAFHGIAECFARRDRWFTAVTCTDGAGSSRVGPYAEYTDEMMRAVRRVEQRQAGAVGQYAAVLQLDYPSAAVKDPRDTRLIEDLAEILRAARPQVVYTHNPADKHATHVGVGLAALAAMRRLPRADRPRAAYGVEVWRDLDWLPDDEKVALDVGAHENLASALTGLFDSQIVGGKRYDLATLGRRRANATYFQSHSADAAEQLNFAMDLTPLVRDEALDVVEYVVQYVRKLEQDIRSKLTGRIQR